MSIKMDLLPGTKYRPLPRITIAEILNKLLIYMQLNGLEKEEQSLTPLCFPLFK